MRPTQKTIEMFRARLGASVPPEAKTPEQQWAFLSGFHTGLTGHGVEWRGRTLEEAALWSAGRKAAHAVL